MKQILLLVFLIALIQVNAQRPDRPDRQDRPDRPPTPPGRPNMQKRPFENRDFSECFAGLSTLQPYLLSVVENVDTNDKDTYVELLKKFFDQFKQVADKCGVSIPEGTGRGNPEQCDQDITYLTNLLKQVKEQAQKPEGEQNVIAVITMFMGLANQIPRCVQDCTA